MGCCGKPNNRKKKEQAQKNYYARYAYLTGQQKQAAGDASVSKCSSCDALTTGNPCSVCKTKKEN